MGVQRFSSSAVCFRVFSIVFLIFCVRRNSYCFKQCLMLYYYFTFYQPTVPTLASAAAAASGYHNWPDNPPSREEFPKWFLNVQLFLSAYFMLLITALVSMLNVQMVFHFIVGYFYGYVVDYCLCEYFLKIRSEFIYIKGNKHFIFVFLTLCI